MARYRAVYGGAEFGLRVEPQLRAVRADLSQALCVAGAVVAAGWLLAGAWVAVDAAGAQAARTRLATMMIPMKDTNFRFIGTPLLKEKHLVENDLDPIRG